MSVLTLKKHIAYLILLVVYLLSLSMTIVCLVFAIKKRQSFLDMNLITKNDMIEILYLFLIVATIISAMISMCCSLTSNEPHILGDGGAALVQFILAIVWIILPAAYTVLSKDELGDIPLSCPKSLIDNDLLLYACIKRRTNIIFMWINSGIMILSTFILCFCFYGLKIQSEEEILVGIPISISASEASTPPVLKRINPFDHSGSAFFGKKKREN
ncbi:hypothetical protein C1645_774759 [Glomus cerebriforme]|uniref:Uncharacterized protein n=1 Tax=Glomus cerebriforme TaxID=658196 RepID=A0A397SQS7_9GLOM|nr:hypothetical protein C1645_774759 [Glomus cerebriforme]